MSRDNIQDEFLTEARACFCDGDLWVFAKNIIKWTTTLCKSIWGKYLTINTSHQVQQRPSWSTLPSAGRSWQFCKPCCWIFRDILDITFVTNLKKYNLKKSRSWHFFKPTSWGFPLWTWLILPILIFPYFPKIDPGLVANHIVGVFLTTFLTIILRLWVIALRWYQSNWFNSSPGVK